MNIPDLIGMIFWWAIPATPLVTYLILTVFLKIRVWKRVLVAMALAIPLAMICYALSLSIIFRDGMGP